MPQGSILGPLLFLLYINDLPAYLHPAQTLLFADDTTVLVKGINKDDIENNIKKAITRLEDWLVKNKLQVNTKKTVYIKFTTKQQNEPNETIELFKNKLSAVSESKFLGIIIHENLKWNSHIQCTNNKLNTSCFMCTSEK